MGEVAGRNGNFGSLDTLLGLTGRKELFGTNLFCNRRLLLGRRLITHYGL